MKTVISFNQDTNGNSLYSELPDGGKEIVFEWLHKLKFIKQSVKPIGRFANGM